jgi:hypothetical protein
LIFALWLLIFALRCALRRISGPAFWNLPYQARLTGNVQMEEETMDGLIYLIGLIVVIMAILSFFGLR